MGGRRPAPNIINTPSGPRRPRGDSRDETRTRFPRPRRPFPRDIYRPVGAVDKEGNPVTGFDPRRKISAPDTTERRERPSGDSFRESRTDRRRMAGDRRDYFGRVRKGFFGRVPKRPAPDTRDRKPFENFTGTMGMADGSPELIRKRKEAFEKKVNNLSPERRKEFEENRLRFRFTEEEGGRPRLKRTYQDQNIARTDV